MIKKPLTHSMLCFIMLTLMLSGVALYGQHPNINLYDKDGELIDPINDENADLPFSIKQTCGLCHDYDLITAGYHFQQGWDVISDDYGDSLGQPWILSNGRMGKWCPLSFQQMAKKKNEFPEQIDLTVYDFVGTASYTDQEHTCGACHPGGGGLEYDRDGNRYDEELAANPGIRDSLDGDYYKSNWDKSGVVEGDCFICHLENYNFSERVYQLKQGNFQWAVVAASRFGIVTGSVNRGKTPTVMYNKRFFNDDGTISIDMSWPPPDENCMFCHGNAGLKKRGFSCDDIINPDVHNQQIISCASCHPSGIDHNFAGGNTVRAEKSTYEMKTCGGCHLEGLMGASVPKHMKIRPSHLENIACEACHIPELGRAASVGIDATTGNLKIYTSSSLSEKVGTQDSWQPIYHRDSLKIIHPMNYVQAVYWGNLDADDIIYPLFKREHAEAWKLYGDQIKDDNGDEYPEVNTTAEIVVGLKAFIESLKENPRFSKIQPVYIKGKNVYYLDEKGQLGTLDREVQNVTMYSIKHNVAPSRHTLGNNGCGDCHAPEAHFFKGQYIVDLYDTTGQPVMATIGRGLGCSPAIFKINSFHQQILSPAISFIIILIVFLITLHYHRFGPKRIPFVYGSGEVKRFTFLERGIHLFRLISFMVLAITGMILAFNWSQWQSLLFSSPAQLLAFHIVAGIVFIVTTVMGIVIWSKDAIFRDYDKAWIKLSGGYLGHKGEVPSGRFNAGQKMFYWFTTVFGLLISASGVILIFKSHFVLSFICLISTIHNLVAFFMIAGVFAHAYLGTIANPGTWRVLIDGYVTRIWAKHHHPNWYYSMFEDSENSEGEDKKEITEEKSED